MLKNKIPLHSFVGINLLLMGLLSLSVAYSVFTLLDQRDYQWSVSEDEIFGIIIPAVFGTLLLFSGLGLLLKMKWARISVNFLLFIVFALLSITGIVFILNFTMGFRDFYSLITIIGIFLFSLCTLLSIFFFINNTKVVDGLHFRKNSNLDIPTSENATQ